MITQSRLKELFDYDPNTGVFLRTLSTNCKKGVAGSVRWSLDGKSYVRIRADSTRHYAHRLAWIYAYGAEPLGEIDHIDGDGCNNSISNLRDIGHSENQRNKKLGSNNKSGVYGVRWDKRISKWVSSIQVDSKQIHLGTFANKLDACCARKSAERFYCFHENHGKQSPQGNDSS